MLDGGGVEVTRLTPIDGTDHSRGRFAHRPPSTAPDVPVIQGYCMHSYQDFIVPGSWLVYLFELQNIG